MRVRQRSTTRFRAETHGLLLYSGIRDDFFYCDWEISRTLRPLLGGNWSEVPPDATDLVSVCVQLDILESDVPQPYRAFSGPGLLGRFPDRVAVARPMVVNCFVTGHCPLDCHYCHAEDLMAASPKAAEPPGWLNAAVDTARHIPSLVVVLTGGDPLSEPDKLASAMEALSDEKAVVVDTSGYDPAAVERLTPALVREGAHVRVSLDSFVPAQNDRFRPIARRGGRGGALDAAIASLRLLMAAGVPVSVQSVITKFNSSIRELRSTCEGLVSLGVRNWVLHLFTPAGKGARRGQLLRDPARAEAAQAIRDLVHSTVREGVPIDIRITDATPRPNSILLVGPDGTLYTEGSSGLGKIPVYSPSNSSSNHVLLDLFSVVDAFGHTERYLNLPAFFFEKGSPALRLQIPLPPAAGRTRVLASSSETSETELKLFLGSTAEAANVGRRLLTLGARLVRAGRILDQYFDDAAGTLKQRDFVVRLRTDAEGVEAAVKGPRVLSADGVVERLEIEVPAGSAESARASIARRWDVETWHLEKYQLRFESAKGVSTLDLVPKLGWFLEIEGPLDWIEETRLALEIGPERIRRLNYAELLRAAHRGSGARHELSEEEASEAAAMVQQLNAAK